MDINDIELLFLDIADDNIKVNVFNRHNGFEVQIRFEKSLSGSKLKGEHIDSILTAIDYLKGLDNITLTALSLNDRPVFFNDANFEPMLKYGSFNSIDLKFTNNESKEKEEDKERKNKGFISKYMDFFKNRNK